MDRCHKCHRYYTGTACGCLLWHVRDADGTPEEFRRVHANDAEGAAEEYLLQLCYDGDRDTGDHAIVVQPGAGGERIYMIVTAETSIAVNARPVGRDDDDVRGARLRSLAHYLRRRAKRTAAPATS